MRVGGQGWNGWVLRAPLLVALCVAVFLLNCWFGVGLMGNMADRDFMSLWVGGKALVLGLDPYDPQVWPDLRARYGSLWIPDPTCPFPAWTLAIFTPLSLLPLERAVALLMTMSELSLLVAVLLLVGTMGCRRDRVLCFSGLVGAFFFRPFISALTSGQITPLLLLVAAGAVALYANGRGFLAGLLFALLLLKPNLFILFFPALGLLMLARRDWQGLLGLGLGGGGPIAVSWLLRPSWIVRWLGVSGKTSVAFGTPTLWGLAFDWLGPERWVLLGTLAVVLVSAVTLLLVVRRREQWLLGIGVAVCSSLLVTPYLWNYDQLLLLVPALVALCRGRERRALRVAVWFVVLLVIPWGLFLIANVRKFDPLSALVTLMVAVYLCVAYWGRDRLCRREQVLAPGKGV